MLSIKEARKKLGKRGEEMSDKQIYDLLALLRFICGKAIDSKAEQRDKA